MDSECEDPASASQRALRRQVSEVGAVCSNSARTDLCGGRWATGVPTATEVVEGRQRRRSRLRHHRESIVGGAGGAGIHSACRDFYHGLIGGTLQAGGEVGKAFSRKDR